MTEIILPVSNYNDYFTDESKFEGFADSIAFPRSAEDIVSVMRASASAGVSAVTVQGARTGISGGAVPVGGLAMNLERMDRIIGCEVSGNKLSVRVEPGVRLQAFREWAAVSAPGPGSWMFPPDPTETTATLGGMAACNSSGAMSYKYGPMRNYVEGLETVLADGSVLKLERGRGKASEAILERKGVLPRYGMPEVKNSAGYYFKKDMDLIDLFMGSEGTLGIIAGLTLKLIPAPASVFSLLVFFPDDAGALEFVKSIKAGEYGSMLAAVEFFDGKSISLAALPLVPPDADAAVYVEYHADTTDKEDDMLSEVVGIIEECGGDSENSIAAADEASIAQLHSFRHSIPEAVNLKIAEKRKHCAGITKLGTDMSVPGRLLDETYGMYKRDLESEGLDYAIFGHIGDNHLHVNILPSDSEEYMRGRALHIKWAKAISGAGGSVSAEHGIGKLKTDLLEIMYGHTAVEEMRALKKLFDPHGILNPNNVFPAGG